MAKAVSVKQKMTTQFTNLYKWNIWLAAIHAVQGLFVLLLSATRLFPIETTYLTRDPIASELVEHPVLTNATKHLFDINLAYVVAAMFFVAAIAHGLVATAYRQRYEGELQRGINKMRWMEYALSAGLLFVALGLLVGVTSLSTLALMFVLAVIMNLVRLAIEIYRSQGQNWSNRLLSGISSLADAILWVVIVLFMWGAGVYGSGVLPSFVFVLLGSALLLFAGFAVNMYLQYRKVGKWADHLYGEHVYMLLSLTAKTVLAWQIVAGALRS